MQLARRSQMFLAALALVAWAIPGRAAEVNKYLPDDAEIIMVLNVQQILSSPIVQKNGLPHIKQLLQSDETAKKTLEALGFDPLKDLTRVTVTASAVSQDAKGVIIVEGNFDVAKFESKALELAKEKSTAIKAVVEDGHKLLEFKGGANEDKPAYGAMIDKNTIVVASDKAFVLDSFDRAAGKKKVSLKKEVLALVEKANQSQSMWLVAPGAIFAKSPLAEDDKAKKIIEKIDNVSVGFNLAEDFTMATAIVTKSADAAKEISEELKNGLEQMKGLLALVAGQQKELAPLVDIIGSMKVATENTTVTLKSEVSHEMIEKSLKK
jgi:hypothetical protein